jgi:hypothetical protein
MEPHYRRKGRPEDKIRDAIRDFLEQKKWYVKIMHGSMYQSGFPDLFTCHARYGIRLIEVKLPDMKGSHFTAAQMEEFPKLSLNGAGIWILTAATEHEYEKLFKPYNWSVYMLRHR